MEKTILVAGKDMPSGSKFAEGLSFSKRNIVITGINNGELISDESDTEENPKSFQNIGGIVTTSWNKSSSLSARTLVIQTEISFERMDEAVLYFDEDFFQSVAGKLDAGEVTRICDEQISCFQYLALEILSRYEKKNSIGNPGKLVFLLREGPCMVDAIHSPVLRNGSNEIANPIVAASASAFSSFAENIAAVYGDMEYVNIVLVRGDKSMETAKSDDTLGSWLGNYLDAVDCLKNKLSTKKSIQWVKPGAKNPGGFNLFK